MLFESVNRLTSTMFVLVYDRRQIVSSIILAALLLVGVTPSALILSCAVLAKSFIRQLAERSGCHLGGDVTLGRCQQFIPYHKFADGRAA